MLRTAIGVQGKEFNIKVAGTVGRYIADAGLAVTVGEEECTVVLGSLGHLVRRSNAQSLWLRLE